MEELRNFKVIGIISLAEFKKKFNSPTLQVFVSKSGNRYATNSDREMLASITKEFDAKLPAWVWHFREVKTHVDQPDNEFWLISNTVPQDPTETL